MLWIVLVKYCRRDIRYISSSITLSSDVDLELRNPEDRLKVLEEVYEILSDFLLARGCHIANGEASADRLFYPQDVCQVDPGVWVEGWVIHAPTPDKPPVFLEESLEGTTTRSAIEPDCNFVNWFPYGGLEDKEESS